MTFEIAKGYVEIHGEIDRRSVITSADRLTAGVADQMNTGVAFSNSRRGGRMMGEIFGIHGGPHAAGALTSGMADWVGQGQSVAHLERAGSSMATTVGGAMAGRDITAAFTERFTQDVNTRLANNPARFIGSARVIGDGIGGSAGNTAGRTIRERITRTIHETTSSDTDKPGTWLGRLLGNSAGPAFGGALTGGEGFFSSISGALGPVGLVIGAGIAVAAFPVVASAISAAVGFGASLGVIGLGAYLLREEPKLKSAAASLKKTWVDELTKAAQPLLQPFVKSLGILEDLGKELGPSFGQMFREVAPMIEPLTRGVAGMVREMLPGFINMLHDFQPFFKDLEQTLPRLGRHLGLFFQSVGEGGPGATAFFRDLLHIVGLALVGLGWFVEGASKWYGAVREIILSILTGFRTMWRTITGNFDDLNAAVQGFRKVFGERLGALRDRAVEIWKSITKGGSDMLGWFTGLPGRIGGALTTARNRITSSFSNAEGMLRNAGRNIIQGLINGIVNAVPGLRGTLGWVTSMLPDWKGPEEVDKRILYKAGQLTMGGYQDGIKSEIPSLRSVLGQLTGGLPAMANPFGAASAASSAPAGGTTINLGGIHVHGTDLTEPGAAKRVAGVLFDAIESYKKQYA